jgi:hypothetical protein
MSLPLNKKHGIIVNFDSTSPHCDSFSHWIAFRNLYLESIYSPLADKYASVITGVNKERLVNRLDLLQYSTLNTQMYFNIETLMACDDGAKLKTGPGPKGLFHVYFDLMVGFLVTQEKIQNDDSSIVIPSALYGMHIDFRTQKSVSENVTFDLGLEFFQIDPFTSSIDPYLNPQFHNISDTSLQSNKPKPFQRAPNPLYFNINLEISSTYFSKLISIGNPAIKSNTTGSKSSSSLEVYLNADVFSNFRKPQIYDNTYFQVQLGVALSF